VDYGVELTSSPGSDMAEERAWCTLISAIYSSARLSDLNDAQ